jgi:type VI secretion system secreted protein Hcp
VRFIKRKDKASPMLYQALVNNENLTTVKFRWFRPKVRAAGEEHYYTIELENASVCELQDVLPDTLDPNFASAQPREVVALTYQKITWTWELTGMTSYDDWTAPVA